jgi:hypothetical protein
LPTPPGLTLPPGLPAPPGLPCPRRLAPEQTDDGEREEEERVAAEKPPGVFAPSCPPGMFAPTGPPGVFFLATSNGESTCSSPPGVWEKEMDGLSSGDVSTDVESDSEMSLEDSFCD